jgi:hypothetical protein
MFASAVPPEVADGVVLICHVAEATAVDDVAAHVRGVDDIVEAAGFDVKIAVGVIAYAAVVEVEKRTVCSTTVPLAPATGVLLVETLIAVV